MVCWPDLYYLLFLRRSGEFPEAAGWVLATLSWLWGIGWLLGIAGGITAITLAFWVGAIVGVALLYLSKNKYGMKSSIAFGPFMILGTAISFFWGEKIIGFLF